MFVGILAPGVGIFSPYELFSHGDPRSWQWHPVAPHAASDPIGGFEDLHPAAAALERARADQAGHTGTHHLSWKSSNCGFVGFDHGRTTSKKQLGDHIWEASGRQLDNADKPWRHLGDNIWETAFGRHLGDNWETS